MTVNSVLRSGSSSPPSEQRAHNHPIKYSLWRYDTKKVLLAWVLLIVCLTLTCLSTLYVKNDVESLARKDFNYACDEIKNRLSSRLQQHAQILRSASAFFAINGHINRKQWHDSITRQNIEQALPGIQGIGFSIIIPPEQLPLHQTQIRSEGFPEYAVRPAGKRDIYTSIIYLEPFSGRNLRAFGYDMFSEPIRRKAMEHARDFDEATLSGKVILVQETNKDIQAGTLMYVPVYENGKPAITVDERRKAIRGWVYSPYRMNDLMQGILSGWELGEGRQIRLEIYDENSLQPEALLYDSRPNLKQNAVPATLLIEKTSILFNGHRWNLRLTHLGSVSGSIGYSRVWYVVIGGAAISSLIFVLYLLRINTGYRAHLIAEHLTQELHARTEDLAAESLRLKILLETASDGIHILDVEGNLVQYSRSFLRELGYNDEEAKRLNVKDWDAKIPQDQLTDTIQALIKNPSTFETRHRRKDGTIFDAEINAKGIELERKSYLYASARDITERRRTEAALQEAYARYNDLARRIPVGVYLCRMRREGNISFEYVSPRLCEILDVIAEDLLRDPQEGFKMIHPEELPGLLAANHTAAQTLKPFRWEGRCIIRGALRWVRMESDPTPLPNGDSLWSGVITDTTERRFAEEALAESRQALATAQSIAHLGSWRVTLSESGQKWYGSKELYQLYGYPEDMEMTWETGFDRIHPDDRAAVSTAWAEAIWQDGPKEWEHRIVVNGEVGWLHITVRLQKDEQGKVQEVFGTCQDITERKRAEERLKRLETFEVMGRIAGGVAHDLNNILGVSVGYADLLMDEPALSPPLRNSIRIIKESGEKAAAVVQDLLTMTRKGVMIREVMNLNRTIKEYLASPEYMHLETRYSEVRLMNSLDPQLLNLSGSDIHLYKLVMNLVMNAVEATGKGGTVRIITGNEYLEAPLQGYELIEKGEYAVLTVSDTGEGISSSDMQHIFEPFYTTKKMKMSGSGLGLSVVWGVVKDHNGFLDIQSEKGKGTTFRLYFPVTREELPEREVSRRISPDYMGHGEKILVVDDEKWQYEMAEAMLKPLNYNLRTVSSGEEAVEYLQDNKANLIILDMLMEPGMDGLDTYKAAIKLHPGQKAIIVSGFTETERTREAQRLGAGKFIRKPYIQERLAMEVRKELERV